MIATDLCIASARSGNFGPKAVYRAKAMIVKSSFENIKGHKHQEEAVEWIAIHSPVALRSMREFYERLS